MRIAIRVYVLAAKSLEKSGLKFSESFLVRELLEIRSRHRLFQESRSLNFRGERVFGEFFQKHGGSPEVNELLPISELLSKAMAS
jgi:hypothetical protein